MDIIKDPIIVGLIVSAVSYIYVQWLNKSRKIERDDDEKITDMRMPIILGVVAFLGLSVWNNREKILAPDLIIKIPTNMSIGSVSSVASDSIPFKSPMPPVQNIASVANIMSPDTTLLTSGIGKPRTYLDNF